jgi:hypothetical protein
LKERRQLLSNVSDAAAASAPCRCDRSREHRLQIVQGCEPGGGIGLFLCLLIDALVQYAIALRSNTCDRNAARL